MKDPATTDSGNQTGVSSPRRAPARYLRVAAVVLALGGWWLSFDLLRLTGGAAASNPWLQSTCGPESGGGCFGVLQSRWARDASGTVPVAATGMAYFAFLTMWFAFVGPTGRSRWAWHLPVLLIVLIAVLLSAQFMAVMAWELRQWCGGCVAVHIINALLLLIALATFPWRRRAHSADHPAHVLAGSTLVGAGALALLQIVFAMYLVVGSREARYRSQLESFASDPNFVSWHHAQQAVRDVPFDPQRPFVGDLDAAHTVVVFSDFQCGHCGRATGMLSRLAAEAPAAVRVQFRHFPQDAECNPAFDTSFHPAACAAARAAEAARVMGGDAAYRAMRAALRERSDRLPSVDFTALAAELDLDTAAFKAALSAPAVDKVITEDVELGRALGLTSVPALYLDGRLVRYWPSETAWRRMLGVESPTTATGSPADQSTGSEE